jgi:hypothetical protein
MGYGRSLKEAVKSIMINTDKTFKARILTQGDGDTCYALENLINDAFAFRKSVKILAVQ